MKAILSSNAHEKIWPNMQAQLMQMGNVGIKEVMICTQTQQQLSLMKDFFQNKNLPKLEYCFSSQLEASPFSIFSSRELIQYIGRDDFLWTDGELAHDETLLQELILRARENHSSAACQTKSIEMQPFNEKYFSYKLGATGKIVSHFDSTKPNFALYFPFYFQNSAMRFILEEIKYPNPHMNCLLRRIASNGGLSIAFPSVLTKISIPPSPTPQNAELNQKKVAMVETQ